MKSEVESRIVQGHVRNAIIHILEDEDLTYTVLLGRVLALAQIYGSETDVLGANDILSHITGTISDLDEILNKRLRG